MGLLKNHRQTEKVAADEDADLRVQGVQGYWSTCADVWRMCRSEDGEVVDHGTQQGVQKGPVTSKTQPDTTW